MKWLSKRKVEKHMKASWVAQKQKSGNALIKCHSSRITELKQNYTEPFALGNGPLKHKLC